MLISSTTKSHSKEEEGGGSQTGENRVGVKQARGVWIAALDIGCWFHQIPWGKRYRWISLPLVLRFGWKVVGGSHRPKRTRRGVVVEGGGSHMSENVRIENGSQNSCWIATEHL